jgi:hypothetical protein
MNTMSNKGSGHQPLPVPEGAEKTLTTESAEGAEIMKYSKSFLPKLETKKLLFRHPGESRNR